MDIILTCTRVSVGNECVNEISIVKHVISEPALAIRQQHWYYSIDNEECCSLHRTRDLSYFLAT